MLRFQGQGQQGQGHHEVSFQALSAQAFIAFFIEFPCSMSAHGCLSTLLMDILFLLQFAVVRVAAPAQTLMHCKCAIVS